VLGKSNVIAFDLFDKLKSALDKKELFGMGIYFTGF